MQNEQNYLKPETILRFLTKEDEALDTFIMCTAPTIPLFTFDQSIYEAIGSMTPEEKQNINLNKFTKLLEVLDITSMRKELKKQRPILREKRVEELRAKANQAFMKDIRGEVYD